MPDTATRDAAVRVVEAARAAAGLRYIPEMSTREKQRREFALGEALAAYDATLRGDTMPDPQAATEVEGVYWCVAHQAVAYAEDEECDLAPSSLARARDAGPHLPCNWRRLFVDPRPEAQVQR